MGPGAFMPSPHLFRVYEDACGCVVLVGVGGCNVSLNFRFRVSWGLYFTPPHIEIRDKAFLLKTRKLCLCWFRKFQKIGKKKIAFLVGGFCFPGYTHLHTPPPRGVFFMKTYCFFCVCVGGGKHFSSFPRHQSRPGGEEGANCPMTQ